MILHYVQVAVADVVLTSAAFNLPDGNATAALLQAETGNIRYTLDGTQPTETFGFLLLTTTPPLELLIEDVSRIKFIKAAGAAGAVKLNAHFFGGRNI